MIRAIDVRATRRALAAFAVAALVFAGCGGTPSASPGSSATPAPGTSTPTPSAAPTAAPTAEPTVEPTTPTPTTDGRAAPSSRA